jgi:elongation factor P--(R)-beta-lysine ligase
MSLPSPYWDRDRHADRKPFLDARAAILRAVRDWFARQGFTEVEPGMLVASPGAETHIDAFESAQENGEVRYLHTSPEFAMKKLLAAGETRIFYLGKTWRRGETGPLHAPEFTMLEWYRAGAGWKDVAEDALAIVAGAANALGVEMLRYGDRTCSAASGAVWPRVQEVWSNALGGAIKLSDTMDEFGEPNRDMMVRLVEGALSPGFTVAPDDTWSDLFSRVMTSWVEPAMHADLTVPIVLHDYPAPEAALAQRRRDDPRFAERFELYACGVELANGFGELTDPVEQRRRLVTAMDEKEKRYGKRWPIDEDFLAALAHVPPSSGVALGFDRLVMLATGARHINDVLWTPQ